MKLSVLIVDDEQHFRLMAEQALHAEGFEVASVASLARAKIQLDRCMPDVILLDRRLPDGDGISFLRDLGASHGKDWAAVVVVTAYGDVQNAVEALRAGAHDYLTKPLQVADLVIKLRKVMETRCLKDHLALAHLNACGLPQVEPQSPRKQAVMQRLQSVAKSPLTPVMIMGASGVG
ncbi:MAG: response regulator, partial [Deltaproteobacteria bacterium]